MDQLIGGLFGGQDNDDDVRRRSHAQDFVSRYETGLPHEGYSDEEAVHNYRQVAGRLSPQQYEEAAAETFGRMSKDERRQLRQEMKQRGGGQFGFDNDNDDPRELARAAAQYRQQDASGGGLAGLFGAGGGGLGGMMGGGQQGGGLGGMLGGVLGGGQQQGGMMGGSQQGGGMLDNPLAKVAMGGIAAMAMKKMMGGG